MKTKIKVNPKEYKIKGFSCGAPIWWRDENRPEEINQGFISYIWTRPEGGCQVGIRVEGSQWECKLSISEKERMELINTSKTTHRESLGSTRIQVLKK